MFLRGYIIFTLNCDGAIPILRSVLLWFDINANFEKFINSLHGEQKIQNTANYLIIK